MTVLCAVRETLTLPVCTISRQMSKCSRFPDKSVRLPEENHREGKLTTTSPIFWMNDPFHFPTADDTAELYQVR